MSVDRYATCRSGAELIVEYLEREQPIITRRKQRLHEIVDRQVSLPREITVMPAPRQVIHLEQRRVRHLHEKDAVARDRPNPAEVRPACQDMKAVEHEADGWMVGPAHRLPGVAIVVNVASP